MAIIATLLKITGGLCLFLYGMKVMSEGIQKAAGDRLQRFLNYITGNRFIALFTGFAMTAIIQSSSATTVMVVSLVNAGLLNLTQAIGVILGANIGTTVTAWIVSLIGFSFKLSEFALPAVGIGFIFSIIEWKHRETGEFILGFGLLFIGLDFLTKSMPPIGDLSFVTGISNLGIIGYIIGLVTGIVITLLMHSSSAAVAIVLTMAYNGVVNYEIAVTMILGANIGTTIDAVLASIGAKTNARRTALVHVLMKVTGALIALPLLRPILFIVQIITPGTMTAGVIHDPMITTHLAMFHTVYNVLCSMVFLPFVKQISSFATFVIKDEPEKAEIEHYKLIYTSGMFQYTPEINILRAEKEIRHMAGIAKSMFVRFSSVFQSLPDLNNKESAVEELNNELKQKENYADEMYEQIGAYLMECAKIHLNRKSEQRISHLLRVISDLENMTDECCNMSYLLESSVKKGRIFEKKKMDAFVPYLQLVKDFLHLVHENLGSDITQESLKAAAKLEEEIDKSRNKLRKLGRKRLESGKDVKTELLFIELVRRVEKLGDYCYEIAETLAGT